VTLLPGMADVTDADDDALSPLQDIPLFRSALDLLRCQSGLGSVQSRANAALASWARSTKGWPLTSMTACCMVPWEDPKPGIVAVVLPDGTSRQVAEDLWFPNGMAVLGDDTLIVAESHADRLSAWTITDSGELVDRRVWADLELRAWMRADHPGEGGEVAGMAQRRDLDDDLLADDHVAGRDLDAVAEP
jgi:hypothetical protein